MISKIRHSSTLVAQLPPHLQRAARDSYAISLRAVFIFAAVSTLAAYLVRLPVRALPALREPFARCLTTHTRRRTDSRQAPGPTAPTRPFRRRASEPEPHPRAARRGSLCIPGYQRSNKRGRVGGARACITFATKAGPQAAAVDVRELGWWDGPRGRRHRGFGEAMIPGPP